MSARRVSVRIAAIVAAAVLMPVGARPVAAQSDSGQRGQLVTGRDVAWFSAAVGASVALVSVDARMTDQALRSPMQQGGFIRSSLDVASEFGGPGAIAFSAGLWGIGKLTHHRALDRIGLRSMEAIAVSGVVTSALKGITGRARPDHRPGESRNFALARGIRDSHGYDSFPSGHATTAFALASVLDAEWARFSPTRPRWIRPALYAAASLTAASRVFDNRHWVSDVVLGSTIGVLGGHAVVRWHADRP